jgi:hypothetical protein
MEYNAQFRSAAQLTARARAAAQAFLDGTQLSRFLPSIDVPSLNFTFKKNQLNVVQAAGYRAPDATSQFGADPGSQSVVGELPPISRKRRISEFQQLQMMGQSDLIGDQMDQKAETVAVEIAARVALAQGNGVDTGKVTISENGVIATVDFGRAAGNTVTAANLWSATDTDVLADISGWRNYLIGLNDQAPEVAMLSSSILAALQANTSIIKAFYGRGTDLPSLIGAADVQSVLARFFNLATVVNDDKVKVGATTTTIVPSDHFLLLPQPGAQIGTDSGVLGNTQWGIPAEVTNPKFGVSLAEGPGIFAADFNGHDPEGHNVLASAIVIPVVEAANYTFSADVL